MSATPGMSEDEAAKLVLRIGDYQLRNLLANRVGFHFFDLRPDGAPTAALLASSLLVPPDGVLAKVREDGFALDAPIVLICENGSKSMAAAIELAQNSFINVFVVEGGTSAL